MIWILIFLYISFGLVFAICMEYYGFSMKPRLISKFIAISCWVAVVPIVLLVFLLGDKND